MTTAAGIWATAGIGMSMGAGQYFIAVVSAAMIIVMQILFHKIHFLSKEAYWVNVKIVIKGSGQAVKDIETYILHEKIEMKSIKISKADKASTKLELELLFPRR